MPAKPSTGPASRRRPSCSRNGAAAWCCSGTPRRSPPPPCSLHSGAMSPRKPAVLRNGDGQNLRDYLIATAARLIDERGSAGLSVREIAREAQVADGVLYNYFADKEDLLAHALLAHVATVMDGTPPMPPPGTGNVAENLRLFIEIGMGALTRVVPAFAGLLSQPKVLKRFHAMVGGDAALAGEAAVAGGGPGREPGRAAGDPVRLPARRAAARPRRQVRGHRRGGDPGGRRDPRPGAAPGA